MSLPKEQDSGAAIEEPRDGYGGSPLHSHMEFFLYLPSSPSQYSDLCLSPLWNTEEYVNQSYCTDPSAMDFVQPLPCSFELKQDPADNYDKRLPSLQLCSLKERIVQAFRYLKESLKQNFLVQVWLPVKSGNRRVLTTSGSPFILSCESHRLYQYRLLSLMYIFPADDENDDVALGIPGRVFRNKLPEWTPNVQYYSSKEYPLLNHALHYNIRGKLALPLLDSGSCCVGVIEIVATSQKINYAPEVDLLSKALEAVNLRSSVNFYPPCTRVLNKNQQNAFSEILEMLTIVSKTYTLPLAQTWIPCSHEEFSTRHRSFSPGSSHNRSYTKNVFMSICDLAFYVVDAHMWGFREACAEHHLLEGQGAVGRAFSSLNSCFDGEISQLSKADYPLVHYARMFGLQSWLAVPVCNSRTANDIYILEFFLPPHLTDLESQNQLLALISEPFIQSLQNFRILSHKGFGEDRDMEVINFPSEEKRVLVPEHYERSQNIRPSEHNHEHNQTLETLESTDITEASQTGKQMLKSKSREKQEILEVDVIHCDMNTDKGQGNVSVIVPGKEEKCTLEVLKQLYGRSLQDAAESLGVSRSTFKRICRKLGIARWPSHKREKINCVISKTSLGRYVSKKSSTHTKDLEPCGVAKQVQIALQISRAKCMDTHLNNLALNQEKAGTSVAGTANASTAQCERTLNHQSKVQAQNY